MQLNLFNNLPAEGDSKVCAKCQELKPMASYRLYRRATGEPERLVLDHCHDKEVFRGWLCPPCNLGIGLLGDNMQGIERVIAYLQKP